ncbi:MAG: hypothetical protein Q8Q10_01805 [bacterium]|nr:hypothetical protein [bacterium]
MLPKYDLDKIKFSLDQETWKRGVALYEGGKVTEFEADPYGFSAVVHGGHPYRVRVSARRFDEGDCECYLGQNDELCKHMIAVAIFSLLGGKKLTEEERKKQSGIEWNGRIGTLGKDDFARVKKSLTGALRYVKPYNGPSRTWFAYQNSLEEGCNRISAILSDLPAGKETAKLIVDLLLRMDKKLCEGGVDDSDGTVGGCMEEMVALLQEFARADPACIKAFRMLAGRETCFGWEEPLVALVDKKEL